MLYRIGYLYHLRLGDNNNCKDYYAVLLGRNSTHKLVWWMPGVEGRALLSVTGSLLESQICSGVASIICTGDDIYVRECHFEEWTSEPRVLVSFKHKVENLPIDLLLSRGVIARRA